MGETANSGTLLANVVGEEGGSGACRAEEDARWERRWLRKKNILWSRGPLERDPSRPNALLTISYHSKLREELEHISALQISFFLPSYQQQSGLKSHLLPD